MTNKAIASADGSIASPRRGAGIPLHRLSRLDPAQGLHGERDGSSDQAVGVEDDFDAGMQAAPREELGRQREHEEDRNSAEPPGRFRPSRKRAMNGKAEE